MTELFNLLYLKLLDQNKIEVSISSELEVWNDALDENQDTVKEFFDEFIFGHGIFHDLIEKSEAMGDDHSLILSVVDGNILMDGKTYITDWEGEEPEVTEEKSFKWFFDKNGNILLEQ